MRIHRLHAIAFGTLLAAGAVACGEERSAEEAGRQIDEAIEDVREGARGAAEDVGQAAEGIGEELGEAAQGAEQALGEIVDDEPEEEEPAAE